MIIKMIIDEYLEYSKKYKEKYGDKCIVFMQVGSFFEIYTITDNIIDNDLFKIADLCGIQLREKIKLLWKYKRQIQLWRDSRFILYQNLRKYY